MSENFQNEAVETNKNATENMEGMEMKETKKKGIKTKETNKDATENMEGIEMKETNKDATEISDQVNVAHEVGDVLPTDVNYPITDTTTDRLNRHLQNIGIGFEIIKNLSNDAFRVMITGFEHPLIYPNISELRDRGRDDLLNRGIAMDREDFYEFVNVIIDQIKKKQYKYCHEDIGYENNKFFYDLVYAKNMNIESTYQGSAPIKQKLDYESFDDYIHQLSTDILCKPKAAIIILTALSGLYNNIIGRSNDNIVMDVYGDTSHGKTTLLNVACSMFGQPEALIISNNTTECKLVSHAENNVFIANCIDDVLRGGTKHMLELVFSLADGFGRSTMTRKGKTFFGATIMTSERSVFDVMDSSEARGQIYRMIELKVEGTDLADDGDSAQRILEMTSKNYGLIACRLGKYILENYSADDISNMVATTKDKIKKDQALMVSHDRMVRKIAVIRVMGEIFNKCFSTHIDLDQVVSILVNAFFNGLRKVNTKSNLYTMIWDLLDMDYQKDPRERIFADNAASYDPMVHFGFCNADNFDDIFIQTSRLFALANGMLPEEIIQKEKELRATGKTAIKPEEFTGSNPAVNNLMFKTTLREWVKKNWLHPGEMGKRLARKITAVNSELNADKMVYNIIR